MKSYTCWVTKYSDTGDTMPHALVRITTDHAHDDITDAQAMACSLASDLLDTNLRMWQDTLDEMAEVGDNKLWPLVLTIKGEALDNDWCTFMVAGRTREETLTNTLRLMSWLDGTGAQIDIPATLALPEWQEVAA